jgi:hypothetical protein
VWRARERVRPPPLHPHADAHRVPRRCRRTLPGRAPARALGRTSGLRAPGLRRSGLPPRPPCRGGRRRRSPGVLPPGPVPGAVPGGRGAARPGAFPRPALAGRDLPRRVAAAGGLAGWEPTRPIADDDAQRDLWRWLKGYARGAPDLPPLVLAYGRDDRLAPAIRLLAEALPPDRVLEGPGGHDWGTWGALWERVLDSGPLAEALRRGCATSG